MKRTDPRARFEAKVNRSDPNGCHRWTAVHDMHGYGNFYLDGKMLGAHVAALLLDGVTIPPGMTVDHVKARGCRFRDCVRRDHLEVVEGRVNTLRGTGVTAINARKTRCPKRHPLSGDNLYVRPNGKRECRACRAVRK